MSSLFQVGGKTDRDCNIYLDARRTRCEGTIGLIYESSSTGLYQQLCKDLNRDDVNFVVGRLNDLACRIKNILIGNFRNIQVKVAQSNIRFDWIDTEDLNDGYEENGKVIVNDIHMSRWRHYFG